MAMVALILLLVLAFQREKKDEAKENQYCHSQLNGVIP